MVLGVGIDVEAQHRVLAPEVVQHVDHRVRITARSGEVAQARLVGARLLGAAVAERVAARRRAGAGGDGDAGPGRAADRRRSGAEHSDGGDAARALEHLVAAGLVAAGDVAELVGDHRADLVDRVELGQEAGMDEDVLAAGDEGVGVAVLDDVDADARRVEAGGAEERPGGALQRVLDLGVADQRQRRGRPGGEQQGQKRGREADQRAQARLHRLRGRRVSWLMARPEQ